MPLKSKIPSSLGFFSPTGWVVRFEFSQSQATSAASFDPPRLRFDAKVQEESRDEGHAAKILHELGIFGHGYFMGTFYVVKEA